MTSLFEDEPSGPRPGPAEEGAVLLRGFASSALLEEVERIAEAAPFRRLERPPDT